MGGIQTKNYPKLKYFIFGILFVPSLILSTLFISSSHVSAACGAGEYAGAAGKPNGATDPKKCYKDTKTGNVEKTEVTANTPDGGTSGSSTGADTAEDEGTTCAVERIGWILCPIIEGSSKVADYAFQFLANAFLEVEPELLTSNPSGGAGTITAWEQARNLANVMFVIAFIVIIYSQLTGAGLNNYGIKRMLPRLIIAAIAVNVSYYVCQTLVDLSNLLGFNIMQTLQDISGRIGPQVMGANPDSLVNGSTASTGGWIATIAIGALAVAGIVWLLLPVLASIILFVVITCVIIILILLLRKAFIVLLVVVSPIAFVAYLLPNTEKYFSKWLNMFWQLLMVFPIVALLLGGGQLASTIILVAGAQAPATCDVVSVNNNTTGQAQPSSTDASRIQKDTYGVAGECGEEINVNGQKRQASWTLGLVAAGVAVAPLLAVWSVLQGALSAAGAIGGKIGGTLNNMQSRQKNKMGGSLKENGEFRRNQLNAAALSGDTALGRAYNVGTLGSARRSAKRRAKNNYAKSGLHNAETEFIADRSVDDEGNITRFGRSLAGGPMASEEQLNRVRGNAVNARNTLEAEEIKASHAVVDQLTPDKAAAQAQELIKGGDFDSPHLAALLEHLAKINQETFMALSSQALKDGKGSTTVSRSVAGAMSSTGLYSGTQVAAADRGEYMDLRSTAQSNIEGGSLSANKIASMSNNGIDTVDRLTMGNSVARQKVKDAYGDISLDQKGNLGQDKINKLDNF